MWGADFVWGIYYNGEYHKMSYRHYYHDLQKDELTHWPLGDFNGILDK